MKIFSAAQIKQIDEETIATEPISSIDLMERAAMACVKRIIKLINTEDELIIFCGNYTFVIRTRIYLSCLHS